MWNVCEIFDNNSDKANLITAVISVVAAVLVVFLTHSLAARRGKRELKARKLEESYSALSEFKDAGWRLIHERASPNNANADSSSKYYEAHSKVEVLSAIHVPEVGEYISKMHNIVLLSGKIQDQDVSSFQEKLNKLVELGSVAERKIVTKVKRIV